MCCHCQPRTTRLQPGCLILGRHALTSRNALHKVELEQQRFHAIHIQPGGVVRVVFVAMGAAGQRCLPLIHKLAIIQITPIGRHALVKLFSTILKREDGKYFLVTPVEKVGIRVDDAPFLAVEMEKEGEGAARKLNFRTNVDEWVPCNADHRLRFEAAADGGLTPYLHVRADLWAKVTRALYYDLVEMGEIRQVDGREMFGVMSGSEFFSMADAAQARDPV